LTTLPESEKTRVPDESGGTPILAYSAAPISTITGTVATVSTLLISVGAR
jgi:hypothetical protein